MPNVIHCAFAQSYKVLFFAYYIIKEPFIFLACTRYQTELYRIIYDKTAHSRGGNANSFDVNAETPPLDDSQTNQKRGRRGLMCMLSNDLSISFKLLNGWSLWSQDRLYCERSQSQQWEIDILSMFSVGREEVCRLMIA